jgi:hypothetical protein
MALYGRPLQLQHGSFDRDGWNQVYQGQGFAETPRISRCGDVPHGLSIDTELGTVLDDAIVIGDDAEELHLLLAHMQQFNGPERAAGLLNQLLQDNR